MSKEKPTKKERIVAAKKQATHDSERRQKSTKNAKEDKDVEKPSWLEKRKRD